MRIVDLLKTLRQVFNQFSLLAFFLLFLFSCKRSPQFLWSFQTGGPIYATPSISKENLIIGGQDHFLRALDLTTGKLIWERNLGQRILSKPLILPQGIYIGCANGTFYHLDASNGNVKWKFQTGGLIHYDACADDTGIYFGSGDSTFYKISFSGEKIWEYRTVKKFWGNCVFYKNLLLTSSWDSHFYGIDRSTGSVVWKVSSGTFNFGGPELVNDTVYFASHENIYIIKAETGKHYTVKTTYLDHVVHWNGFLWTNENGFIKRDLDGTPRESIRFNSIPGFRPVPGDGMFIMNGDTASLYAVSPQLKILWKIKGEDSFWAPGVLYNNVYYTGNRDGRVYALQLPKN